MDVVYSWVRAQPYPSRVLSSLFDDEKCSILSSSFSKLAQHCHISKCLGCLLIALAGCWLLLNESRIVTSLLHRTALFPSKSVVGDFKQKSSRTVLCHTLSHPALPCTKWRRHFGLVCYLGRGWPVLPTPARPAQGRSNWCNYPCLFVWPI